MEPHAASTVELSKDLHINGKFSHNSLHAITQHFTEQQTFRNDLLISPACCANEML